MEKETIGTKPTELGDAIYNALKENVVLERADWTLDRVERVLKKIQAARTSSNKFRVVIPWLQEFTAFTAPGKYIFISRRLFEVCPNDEMIAFIIGHEIAHHDLGHIRVFPDWFRMGTSLELRILLLALYRTIETRIYGPEQECDADRYALDLCTKAGYDAPKCIALFDVLERYALDIGDLDMVFGPDESDDELSTDATWGTKIRLWLFQRKRGYLPIRDRKKMLEDHFLKT